MTARPDDLPRYDQPPIDEVLIGVQFPSIGLNDADLRDFWKTVRTDYPFVEQRPRYDTRLEVPDMEPGIRIQIMSPDTVGGRLWLISEADDYLVQVQDTTFIQNWRRRAEAYPHFEAVRDRFWPNYERFQDFCADRGKASPSAHQIEVAYINWLSDLPIAKVLRVAASAGIGGDSEELRIPEDQTWQARYLLSVEGDRVERLYAECAAATRKDSPGDSGYQFSLVLRTSKVSGFSDEEISDSLARAREVIVRAFTDLTTEEAHVAWGRLP